MFGEIFLEYRFSERRERQTVIKRIFTIRKKQQNSEGATEEELKNKKAIEK